jgi:hypothetical protein
VAPSASAAVEAPPEIDWKNQIEPEADGPELQARARQLFDAIVKGDAALAEPFWFPKEPFDKLKDIKDPGAYWKQLHRTYERDVKTMHDKRDWTGAAFEKFELGSKPKWVPPGDEANKIGYHRSFRGKIHYTVGAERSWIEVHTVITWQGRWMITHLCDFKKHRCKV